MLKKVIVLQICAEFYWNCAFNDRSMKLSTQLEDAFRKELTSDYAK